MKIASDDFAFPGEYFSFSVSGVRENVRINADVDGQRINVPQCPDPPCHNLRIRIPENSFGKTLTIYFNAPGGESETLMIRVAPPADESALVAGAE